MLVLKEEGRNHTTSLVTPIELIISVPPWLISIGKVIIEQLLNGVARGVSQYIGRVWRGMTRTHVGSEKARLRAAHGSIIPPVCRRVSKTELLDRRCAVAAHHLRDLCQRG